MPKIEIYERYSPPVDYNSMGAVRLNKRDFSDDLTAEDMKKIEEEWMRAVKDNPRIFSSARSLATLYDTQGGLLTFDTTDFKTYLAISRTHKKPNSLSAKIYDSMRIAAVGTAVYLDDGGVFIHKRAKNATHVPNAWDSSVAGLVDIQKTKGINFLYALYEKLQRELNFSQEEIKASEIKVTGVHSSREPDFSGAVSFVVHTNLGRKALENRVRGRFSNYAMIYERDLSDFILAHHMNEPGSCFDGVATLLQALPPENFKDLVCRINRNNPIIYFGKLKNGKFIEK